MTYRLATIDAHRTPQQTVYPQYMNLASAWSQTSRMLTRHDRLWHDDDDANQMVPSQRAL